MALKKKSLKQQVEKNTTVTKGTKSNQQTLKQGIPNDPHRKQQCEGQTVGVNLGVTLNMENYNSLRVDCWLTDSVKPGETEEKAFERVIGICDKVLQETVDSYKGD